MADGFFTELRRRNVFKVATVYLIAGWIVLQVLDVVLPVLGLPEWSFTLILVLLFIGFPFALILAWAFEMTPEGIKLEKDVDRGQSVTHSTGRKIDFVVIGMLVVALMAYFVKDNYFDEPGSAALSSSGEKSIAVLPFASMSPDPENEYFSDGLSEELLNVLAQIKELKVAGRTSSFYYKGKNENLRSIGEQLNVDHVLEGSVRKSGNRVRITAQLISVDDGFHVWSDTYDRELDDIFAIQEEIALAVVAALKVTLLGEEKVALAARPTENAQAHSKYLIARTRMRMRGQENLEQARALFEQSIKEDPDFAPAYSGLADSVMLLAGNHNAIGLEEAQQIAERNVATALTLAPESDDAWTSKAFVIQSKYQIYGKQEDFDKAKAAYEHALRVNPDNSEAHHWYGILLETSGDDEKAADLITRSLELDPLSRNPRQRLAGILIRAGKIDEARNILEETASLYPDFSVAMTVLGNLELNNGNLEKAEYWMSRAASVDDDSTSYFSLALLYADLGDMDGANAALDAIDSSSTFGRVVPLIRASFKGDYQELYQVVEREFEASEDRLFWTNAKFFAAPGAGKYETILEIGRELSPQLFEDDPVVNNVTQGNALSVAFAWYMTDESNKADRLVQALRSYLNATENSFMTNGQLIFRARIESVQDKPDLAMEYLDRAYGQGLRTLWNQGVYPLDRDPFLGALKDNPDFLALIEKIRAENEQTRQAMLARQ